MSVVFVGNQGSFYTAIEDKLFTVYLHDENKAVKLFTAKNGSKYFFADLRLRRSKNAKFYFEAYIVDREPEVKETVEE